MRQTRLALVALIASLASGAACEQAPTDPLSSRALEVAAPVAEGVWHRDSVRVLHGLGDPQLTPDCSTAGFEPNISFVERLVTLTTQSSNGEVVNKALVEVAQAQVCIRADWLNPTKPAAHLIYATVSIDGQTFVGRGACSVYGSVAAGVILPICELAILNPPAGYRFGKIAANGLFNLTNNPDYPLADCYWTLRFHE